MIFNELHMTLMQDWRRNKNNTKGLFIITFFRAANFFMIKKESNKLFWLLGLPITISYKVLIEWILCVELQIKTSVGPGLVIYHGQGLVVHEGTKIGKNVILRNNTTIGNKITSSGKITAAPTIGDNVEIGSNCVIIGEISIGNNSIIGAGSVVTKNVPKNSVVVGNPARIIKIRDVVI